MDEGVETISDAAEAESLRRQGRIVHRRALLGAALLTLLFLPW